MKKMMKMLAALFLALLIVPGMVRADVIFEPWDDAFYDDHREECEYHSRSYTASGPNGEVMVYKSPESASEKGKFDNGQIVWITHIYQAADGIRWGYCEDWEKDIHGWVPMDYLVLIYDGISFEEDYGHQFEEKSGSAMSDALVDQKIWFWQYPGSEDRMEVPIYTDSTLNYDVTFTDPSGTVWVQFSYYMGLRNYWIKLDDPQSPDSDFVADQGKTVQTPSTDIIVPQGSGATWVAVGAVGATVAVTAVLLIRLKKKKA